MKGKRKKPGCLANYREKREGEGKAAPRATPRSTRRTTTATTMTSGTREWRGRERVAPRRSRARIQRSPRSAARIPARRQRIRRGPGRASGDSSAFPCPSSVIDEKVTRETARRRERERNGREKVTRERRG